MKISRTNSGSKAIFLATLLSVANVSFSESSDNTREQICVNALTHEVNRIVSLPAYAAARVKFANSLNKLEICKQEEFKKLRDDLDYQQNLNLILKEINNSYQFTATSHGLTKKERQGLVKQLTEIFIPQ